MKRICPERLASKWQWLGSAEDMYAGEFLAQPRIRETLWFVQAMSLRPGGLEQFASDLLDASPEWKRAMLHAIAVRDYIWSGDRFDDNTGPLRDEVAPNDKLPERDWRTREDSSRHDELIADMALSDAPLRPEVALNDKLPERDWRTREDQRRQALDALLPVPSDDDESSARSGGPRRPLSGCWQGCEFKVSEQAAPLSDGPSESELKRGLAGHLADLCQEQALFGSRVFSGLLPALAAFMDRHRKEAEASLAETEVKRIVFRELDFSLQENVPVPIVGESRFGKTTCVEAWCRSRPGLARMVTVPDSNNERDFYEAHASAFGLEYTPGTAVYDLRNRVQDILRHAGLFIVYDEAHYLVPVTYHKNTPPRRINWVRSQVMDRGIGCAFFATPQNHQQTLDRYVETTGYNFAQWLGRLAPAKVLPESMTRKDLLAVARKQFGEVDIDPTALKIICARAMSSAGFLKNVEFVFKRAQFIARERGSDRISMLDVQQASEDMLPGYIAPPQAPSPAPESEAPARQLGERAETDLRSVRGGMAADSRRGTPPVEAPLIPA